MIDLDLREELKYSLLIAKEIKNNVKTFDEWKEELKLQVLRIKK